MTLAILISTALATSMTISNLSAANPQVGQSKQVRITKVSFTSGGETLAGRLYTPAGVSAERPALGLVISGAWMTVKEQMPHRYAEEMAQRGFVALTFDFRGWGESGGERRQLEHPQQKIEDMIAATSFLRTQSEVANKHVGGLGICASSGYMVTAATRTNELESVALVAPWLHDKKIVEATYGGVEGVTKLAAIGREAETNYQRTKKQSFLPAASLTDKTAIMFGVPYYTEADRGMIPAWRNEADPAFWEGWLSFDAIVAAPHLKQPFFIVHSEAASIPQGAHQFFKAVQARKGQLWLEQVTQLDFYDRDAPVTAASDAVAAHFRRTLGDTSDRDAVISAVSAVAALADARQWSELRSVFAGEVDVDYTSLMGGSPSRVKADDLVAGWQKGLERFTKTEHVVAGHEVTVQTDSAECRARFIATHARDSAGKDRWTCGGRYHYRLQRVGGRWLVAAITMTMEWEQGTR